LKHVYKIWKKQSKKLQGLQGNILQEVKSLKSQQEVPDKKTTDKSPNLSPTAMTTTPTTAPTYKRSTSPQIITTPASLEMNTTDDFEPPSQLLVTDTRLPERLTPPNKSPVKSPVKSPMKISPTPSPHYTVIGSPHSDDMVDEDKKRGKKRKSEESENLADCPLCFKKFPKEQLQQHVDEELEVQEKQEKQKQSENEDNRVAKKKKEIM